MGITAFSAAIALDVIALALKTLSESRGSAAETEYTESRENEFYTKIRPHADHIFPFKLPRYPLPPAVSPVSGSFQASGRLFSGRLF